MSSSFYVQDLPIKKLANDCFVSAQIELPMIEENSKSGINLIVSNRPEGESLDQPTDLELSNQSKLYSVEFKSIPFSGSSLTREKIDNFSQILKESSGGNLLYCKSGFRSAIIWGLSEVLNYNKEVEPVAQIVDSCGYDSSTIFSLVDFFR